MTDKEKELVKIGTEWYKGNKVMSDKEFDQLEHEVKTENPDFNYRLYLDLDGETVKHKVKFPPLKKPQIDKYDLERSDIKKLLASLEGKGYVMTPKLSGCSVVEYYDEDGNLEDIVTKSNDYDGKRKLKSFGRIVPQSVPKGIKAINNEAIVELDRGYGYMSEQKANGLVNSKNKADEIAKLLTFVVWDIQLYEWCTKSKVELMEELRKLKTPQFKVVNPVPYSISALDWSSKFEDKGNYSSIIDGYVIYSSNYNLVTALKFYFNESAEVKIKIEWNLSDKLGLIPKIQFNPVVLEGKNVRQCASNGIETLKSLKIGDGSTIVVARVNSTIPQLVSVIDAKGFSYPKCPTCKTQTSGADILKSVLYCPNPMCKDKINWMIHHVGAVTNEKIVVNTDKYTIHAMNLSSFDPKKKRTHKWKDEDIDTIMECIESQDTQKYYEMLKAHFDLNNDNRKKCKLLIPALLKVLKDKLNM